MLLVRLAAIADRMSPKLGQAIVQFAMRPIELGIGRVTEAKGGKLHLAKTAGAQASTPQGFPKGLAIGGQLTLACGCYCDEDYMVLQ